MYAADDAHFQPQDPPPCASWVSVEADDLDPVSILQALKNGDYYSSTGPEIESITVNGDDVTVHCSPRCRIVVTGGVPGKLVAAGTQVTLSAGRFLANGYLRVTVIDDNGGRAWSNPVRR